MKYLLRKNILRQCRSFSCFAVALAISTFQLSAKAQSTVIEGYDVIVIAGQSNASGYGDTPVPSSVNDDPFDKEIHPLDDLIYQVRHQSATTDCPSGTAFNPAIVPITANDGRGYSRHSLSHRDLNCGMPGRNGFGLAFARRYAEQRLGPNRRVLIVPVAYGATTSYDWRFGTSWNSGKSLKQYMSDHVVTALVANNSNGILGVNRIAALLWSQGEGDIEFCGGSLSATDHCKYGTVTSNVGQSQDWKSRTLEVFGAFRSEFGTYGKFGPDIPVVATGFAPKWLNGPTTAALFDRKNLFYNALKAAQSTIPRFRVTATDEPVGDLESNPSSTSDPNFVHFSTAAQIKLGKRMWVSYGDALRTLSDFNADGKNDLLFRNGSTGEIVGFLMNGSTVTTSASLLGPGAWTVTHTADLNGDGKADLVLRNITDGTLFAFLMNGLTPASSASLLGAGSGWSITHAGDFNGDGKADLALRHTDGRIVLWLMNGTTVASSATLLGAGSGWSITHAADFNGDGKTDLLLRHTDGRVVVWLMNGTTVASSATLLPVGGNGYTPTHSGDLNADGKADILFRNDTDGTIVAFLMNGVTITNSKVIQVSTGSWRVNQVADYNGDGKADLLLRNTDGTLVIFTMNGLAITGSAVVLNATTVWNPMRGGDYNGDGKADIILRKNDGSIDVLLMSGTSVTTRATIVAPGPFTVVPALP
jgi:uncharacterized protein (DUF2141 family)